MDFRAALHSVFPVFEVSREAVQMYIYIYIYIRRWAKTGTLNSVLVRSGCTAEIHLELRFKA